MAADSLGHSLGIGEDVIKRTCSISMEAHKSPAKFYLRKEIHTGGSSSSFRPRQAVIFAFTGSPSLSGWFSGEGKSKSFGETKVDLKLFPSLRSIGNDEVATVNGAFLKRFLEIRDKSSLRSEVEKAIRENEQIIFTGHSSGGPTAIWATVWVFEEYIRSKKKQIHHPLCLTFGSPLMADRIFCHAVRREEWSNRFIHFVTRYDIVPRIALAPVSSTKDSLQVIIPFLNQTSAHHTTGSIDEGKKTELFKNVMRNASCVVNHAACVLMGSTSMLLDTMSRFIELSPYRPCGKYVFCCGNGKLVVVENPAAVLQLLFYSLQLTSEAEIQEIASRSFQDHLAYEKELDTSLEMQDVIYLEKFQEIPLSSADTADSETTEINDALNDLGLSARARLCLRAARESEKQKVSNQEKIVSKKSKINEALSALDDYRTKCETSRVGYYDAFKLQKYDEDFKANVRRLELVGIWDEVIEMLKRYELPDKFEVEKEWVELGTRFRRLVEPIDIANYYRHLKNEDTGPYMTKGRPRRYKYTQRWREHFEQLPTDSSGESCFWADIEEFNVENANKQSIRITDKVLELEKNLKEWFEKEEVKKDAFSKETTLAKWWESLPQEYKARSCIRELIQS